ncbi:MAG: two-component system response regulator [Verrucomicrobia bacterium]|nr:MAG: two-component system response regulator [Verrucomicrobiota bacterium]
MVKRVLIAEDDPMDVFLIQRAFAAAGVSASMRFVRDGQEALDYLGGEAAYSDRQANPLPDLMLLDLKMPRMDGFDVLGWVRERPGLRRLLVTVFTSSDHPEDINRAYDLGANSYLVKPHNAHELSELVQRFQKYWFELNQCPPSLAS